MMCNICNILCFRNLFDFEVGIIKLRDRDRVEKWYTNTRESPDIESV